MVVCTIAKNIKTNKWHVGVVCLTVKDGLFGQFILKHVQGSKGNEGKKEGARNEHLPVASASTRVLNDHVHQDCFHVDYNQLESTYHLNSFTLILL